MTKPKPFRAYLYRDACGLYRLNHYSETNATVIPDGCTVPLPAHVRRLRKAVERWLRGKESNIGLSVAAHAFDAAEAKRRKGRK